MSVRVHCMMGAGGTGKTSVLEKLRELCPPKDTAYFGSVTREFYAASGVDSERDFFALSPVARLGFQLDLLDFYIARLRKAVSLAISEGKMRLIADRSVYDHVAHCIYSNPELLQSTYELRIRPAINTFLGVCKNGDEDVTCPNIFYFPFPPEWDYAHGADGFRLRSWGKDFALDVLMRTMCSTDYRSLGAMDNVVPLLSNLSASARADKMQQQMRALEKGV